MTTKLGKMATHHDELPLIKLHYPIVTWFFEVTRHIKYFVTNGHTKHGKVVTRREGFPPINTLYTCRRPADSRLGKVLSYRERHPHLTPHGFLITWPTWGHVTIRKIYISIFTRLTVTKPDRVLTYGRSFSTQTRQSWPISCSNSNILIQMQVSLYSFTKLFSNIFIRFKYTLWRCVIRVWTRTMCRVTYSKML